jgi:hypothetical protein
MISVGRLFVVVLTGISAIMSRVCRVHEARKIGRKWMVRQAVQQWDMIGAADS